MAGEEEGGDGNVSLHWFETAACTTALCEGQIKKQKKLHVVIDTASIVYGAGSMKQSSVCPSICIFGVCLFHCLIAAVACGWFAAEHPAGRRYC